MPAGDTDADDFWPEAEANVGLAAATREIVRLRAQLAAQQAVVDAAREVNRLWLDRSGDTHPGWRGDVPPQLYRVRITLEHALAALDKAQAAQPECERA